MPVRLNGSTSGYTELTAPAVAGNNSIALPTGNGSAYQILRNGATAGSLEYVDNLVLGTLQNSTSGTSIDFTGIPSWVKRVTVMFNNVSLSSTAHFLVQIGSSTTPTTSGYVNSASGVAYGANQTNSANSSAGFVLVSGANVNVLTGMLTICSTGGNNYVSSHNATLAGGGISGGGWLSLGGTLGMVRITSTSGTDTFDAGSINILYE